MRARSIFVITGITLFALGFIMTVKALPTGSELLGSSTEGSGSIHSASALLVVGFVASLCGLALATIAPAVLFLLARKAKG